MYGCPCRPVPDSALAPLPTPQLLVVGHPTFTYSAFFSWANSEFCLLGRSNSRSWTPALPGWHRRICSRTNATAKWGRRGSDETGSGEWSPQNARGVAVAQLVLGLASQTYEHSYSSGLIPQLAAPFMATFPRPGQSGYGGDAAPRGRRADAFAVISSARFRLTPLRRPRC